jgi:hypothetical protein
VRSFWSREDDSRVDKVGQGFEAEFCCGLGKLEVGPLSKTELSLISFLGRTPGPQHPRPGSVLPPIDSGSAAASRSPHKNDADVRLSRESGTVHNVVTLNFRVDRILFALLL